MLKKIILSSAALCLVATGVFAYSNSDVETANFLANKWVIVDNSSDAGAYRLDDTITRREMLKIMMKISGKTVQEVCASASFSDMNTWDWGCKYGEAALENWYIASNATFRPADNISKIESLKMIMQASAIQRFENDDWRAGYVEKAEAEGLLSFAFTDYNTSATRSWIFKTAGQTFPDFNVQIDTSDIINAEDLLEKSEEELIEFFLGL